MKAYGALTMENRRKLFTCLSLLLLALFFSESSRADTQLGASDEGQAYVFTRSSVTWTEQQILKAKDAASSNSFGDSDAIVGDRAAVGLAEKGAGKVYVFGRSGGSFVFADSFEPESSASYQRFGDAADIKSSTILVGATNGDANLTNDTGAAYFYSFSCSPIQDRVFVHGETYVCSDGVSITTLGTVTVQSGASLSLYAPAITLSAGFSVEGGGLFTAGPLGGAPLRTPSERLELTARARNTSARARPLVPRREHDLLPARRIELADVPGHLWQLLLEANAEVEDLMTNASGDYITFATSGALLETDGNQARDIYLYEIATYELSLISRSRQHAIGHGESSQPRIDGAGRGVYFVSRSADSARAELFHYTIHSEQLVRLTWASSEIAGDVSNPATDASGRHYVYQRTLGDGSAVVFVGELGPGLVTRDLSVSEAAGGLLTRDPWPNSITQHSPAISADGALIAFLERSENEAGLGPCAVAVWDRTRREVRRVSCPRELHGNQAVPMFIEQDTAIEWRFTTGALDLSQRRVRVDSP